MFVMQYSACFDLYANRVALLLLIHCLLLLPLCCSLCCISFDVWAYNVVYDLVIILCM